MVLKGVAKDAYQRLLHGWARSTTPTTSTTTPTVGLRGRPRRVSAGASQLATPTGSTPSGGRCPANVTSLYTVIKTTLVSSLSKLFYGRRVFSIEVVKMTVPALRILAFYRALSVSTFGRHSSSSLPPRPRTTMPRSSDQLTCRRSTVGTPRGATRVWNSSLTM